MKECFIITPIGGTGTETRRETDGLIESVLEPVLSEFEFVPVPAHQISETGSITRQMIKRLLETDLVIANLTELNPNVMYELGIRHCARKPMIVVAKEGTVLPFDLSDERTIFFQNDMRGAEELKGRLREILPKTIGEETPDNPVYRVVDVDLIKLPEGTPDVSMLANKRFSSIEAQLEAIQNSIRSLPRPRYQSLREQFNQTGNSVRSIKTRKPFSVYANTSKQAEQLKVSCNTEGIPFEVENGEMDTNSAKFTAYYGTELELNKIKNLANNLGLEEVA